MSKKSGGPPTHHVVPHDGDWAVRRGGSARVSETFERKQDAVDRGREISRNAGTELRIHGRDGRIQQSDSHGNDPERSKG